MTTLVSCLPWVARAEAEDLYLPATTLAVGRPPWSPRAAAHLLARWQRYHSHAHLPVRAAEKPARNQPCACGSGKKAKRCCGA